MTVQLDVTDSEGVVTLFEEVELTFGGADVLVNNAGVNPYLSDARELDLETWERIFAVNVTGTFTCAREFGRRIADRDATGSIVNVSSVGGVVTLPH